MFWHELILRQLVPDADLVSALAATFGVAPEAVQVTDSVLATEGSLGAEVRFIVERRPARGDFQLQARIYVRDPNTERHERVRGDDLAGVQQLCDLLGTECLASDDDLASESWFLIGGGLAPLRVTLDADRLEDGEFVLLSRQAARAS